jgi:RNase H-like domain found in reverse transcriptase
LDLDGKLIEDKIELIGVCSYQLKDSEKRYNTIEKEMFAIQKCTEHFSHILKSSRFPTIIQSHHRILIHMEKLEIKKIRHLKWYEHFYNSNSILKFSKGQSNIYAYLLRRLHKILDEGETKPLNMLTSVTNTIKGVNILSKEVRGVHCDK